MMFGWELVICDDFDNGHNKVAVAGVNSSVGDQFVVTICKDKCAHGHFPQRYPLRVTDLIINGHGACLVPDDSITDVFSLI